jgi:hypothetical protein
MPSISGIHVPLITYTERFTKTPELHAPEPEWITISVFFYLYHFRNFLSSKILDMKRLFFKRATMRILDAESTETVTVEHLRAAPGNK